MREDEISSWSLLSNLCEQFAIGTWIFRGVANGEHQLIPAIGRPGARRSLQGIDLEYDPIEAADLLRQFKLRARSYSPLAYDADDLEWLALARHHGLPTPFLDWTTSLLAAAFFACQPGGVVGESQCRAAIYAVKRPRLVEKATDAYAAQEPVAYLPPHVSPRITAQNSLFTFHPRPTEPWQPGAMRKIWIPPKAAIEIKVVLAQSGINESSMLPGLDGIAAYLGWLYKREFLRQVSLPEDAGGAFAYTGYTADGGRHYEARLVSRATVSDAVTDKIEKQS
jgi:hypothetical protein